MNTIVSTVIKYSLLASAIIIYGNCMASDSARAEPQPRRLEQEFVMPPGSAQPQVMWWWLNSNIDRQGVTRDLEEMKAKGIGGALIFDAAVLDHGTRPGVAPAPVGPAFMSPAWREIFRHAVLEADRLDLELGVNLTTGFNAGGSWVTPEYGQQEMVWAETILEGPNDFFSRLPLPAGPIYGNDGELLYFQDFAVNNDIARDENDRPIHYRDFAVLAMPLGLLAESGAKPAIPADTPPGRLKHWALKSVHNMDYPYLERTRGFHFELTYDDATDIPGEPRIAGESIVDLTDRMGQDGRLQWQVPKGKWLVLRFGHTHTGVTVQAANPKNHGLAISHLSAEAASRHFAEVGEKLLDELGGRTANSLKYFYLDSWEVRLTNWMDRFAEEFRRRRGYDMTTYLPVLAGRIVESREISNRFLHDYRKTVGDCIADNYYGTFAELSHRHGLEFRAEMATTPLPVDMLKFLGRCDIPFGEFWTETDSGQGRTYPWQRMFGKQAASAAHIYGSRITSAETLTVIGKDWEHGPFELKRTIDQALCSGINRVMIHTFTHSPIGVARPGYEYMAGTHFNPQIAWWEQARAFTEYISRCQFLLQQGLFVADACFYQGDRIPNFVRMKHNPVGLGGGYDYDVLNTEVLLTRVSLKEGRIVLPDGMSYRLLVLPDHDAMDPRALRKIKELVIAGATIVGPKPRKATGLKNYPQSDKIVRELADALWGPCDGVTVTERPFGKGRVFWGKTARQILLADGVGPDFEYQGRLSDTRLDTIHRSVSGPDGETEIYFVTNLKKRWEETECTFRVGGKAPEYWYPDSGEITRAAVYQSRNGRTTLPLRLAPSGSVFVIFRAPASLNSIASLSRNGETLFPAGQSTPDELPPFEASVTAEGRTNFQFWRPGQYIFHRLDGRTLNVDVANIPPPQSLGDSWEVHFPDGWGAPETFTFEKLTSWTDSKVDGIRFFSGSASYHKVFELSEELLQGGMHLALDLGKVRYLAEVTLNGKELGTFWKPPFQVDITSAAQPGRNQLEVRVTNLWPNRMIGDQYLPQEERYTFSNITKFTKNWPLMESGLLGPVQIIAAKEVTRE